MKNQCGIYRIQSIKKPSSFYIGSAIDFNKRKADHLWHLRKNNHDNKRLQNHYNKYGESDLIFLFIIACDKDDLIKHEQFFIDSLNPFFNICRKAGNTLGKKLSEETKEKIRQKRKLQIIKSPSEETKQKIRERLINRIFTEEHRNKL